MKKEIVSPADIRQLVDAFYAKVREDDLLSGIFKDIIRDDWPVHLEKMYRFWESLLLEAGSYHGNPLSKHIQLPVDKEHFDRWLKLFNETIDTHFAGEKAEEAKSRAAKIAVIFQFKIESGRKTA